MVSAPGSPTCRNRLARSARLRRPSSALRTAPSGSSARSIWIPVRPACGRPAARHSAMSGASGPRSGVVYPGERLPDRIRDLPYLHTIYLTLGTAFNAPAAWRVALAGVRHLPVNVIATVGPNVDPAVFGPQPAHVVLERYLPQALVLPRVDAVVSHGGSGTTLGALAEGKPMVMLPMAAGQFVERRSGRPCRRGAGAHTRRAYPGTDPRGDRAGPDLSLVRRGCARSAERDPGDAAGRAGARRPGRPGQRSRRLN